MKDELGTWGAVVGSIVLACLFGGLALAIYPGWGTIGAHFPAISGWTDGIAAVSAIGTCAAVVAALYLAGSQSRADRLHKMEIAQLHAASMSAGLQNTAGFVRSLGIMLGFAGTNETREKVLLRACALLSAPIKKPSIDELAALTPLPNRCAHRIARAYDQIEVVQVQAASFNELNEMYFEPEIMHRALCDQWSAALRRAHDLLQVAVAECAAATELGAPTPTATERFGEWSDDEW